MRVPASFGAAVALAALIACGAPARAEYALGMRLASLELPGDVAGEWPAPPVRAQISLTDQVMSVYVGDRFARSVSKVRSGVPVR